jgi:hypothetical protein
MLIVGSAAALTAIAVFLAWVCIQRLQARWRLRQAEKASRERQENVEHLHAE